MPDKLPLYLLIDASAAMRPVLPALNDQLNSLITALRTKKTRLGEPLVAVYSFAMNLKEITPLTPVRDIQPLDMTTVSFPVRNLKQALAGLVCIISEKDSNAFTGAKPILCIITSGPPTPAIDRHTAAALCEEANFASIHLFNLSNTSNQPFMALTNTITNFGVCDAASLTSAFQAILTQAAGTATRQPVKEPAVAMKPPIARPSFPGKDRQQPGAAPRTVLDMPDTDAYPVPADQALQELTTQNDFLQKKLQSQDTELSRLKQQLESTQKQLQSKGTETATLDELYAKQGALTQSSRKGQSSELKTHLETTLTQLQAKDSEIAALKSQLETALEQLQAKDSEIAALKPQLETTQKQLQAKDSEIAALNTKLTEAPRAVPETTRKEIEDLNLKVDAWYRKAQELEAMLKVSQTQCDTAQHQLTDTQQQLADTQKLLDGQKAASISSTAIQVDLDKANATIRELQAKLKIAEPYLVNLAQAEAENKAQQDFLKQREQEREKKRQQKKEQEFDDLFGLNNNSAGKGFSL